MLHSAPRVLNRFQNSEYRMVGRLAEAATAKASATRKAMFWFLARMPPTMATRADHDGGDPGDLDLLVRRRPCPCLMTLA